MQDLARQKEWFSYQIFSLQARQVFLVVHPVEYFFSFFCTEFKV